MILADTWEDYSLLDTGEGLKLERWGEVLLSRPDPQAPWPKSQPKAWAAAQAVHQREGGGGAWQLHKPFPSPWRVSWKGLTFELKATDFKHTGLFPEQAPNWQVVSGQLAGRKGAEVLNLFGYTGAATVAAAKAGAAVCHVDSSKGASAWCRENLALNGLEHAPVRTLVDDCVKFTARELRRGRKYQGILLDPPAFGRGRQGEVFKLEKDLWPLLEHCVGLLAKDAAFLIVNTYAASYTPALLEQTLRHALKGRGGHVTAGDLALPVESGGVLPCGVTGRWLFS